MPISTRVGGPTARHTPSRPIVRTREASTLIQHQHSCPFLLACATILRVVLPWHSTSDVLENTTKQLVRREAPRSPNTTSLGYTIDTTSTFTLKHPYPRPNLALNRSSEIRDQQMSGPRIRNVTSVDITDISAKLSDLITRWKPLVIKVDKAVNSGTFEVSPSHEPVNCHQFWEHCVYDVNVSSEEKDIIYLRYHRSHNCYQFVQMFALALKELCDTGILLTYNGKPVQDIWVISNDHFDLSDTSDANLTFKDKETGVSLTGMSTYANIEMLRRQGSNVCRRFGVNLPETPKRCEDVRREDVKKFHNSAPYWWIAAVVEDKRFDVSMRKMVHIDICAAAFDHTAFRGEEGSLVSVKFFETPECDMFPTKDLPSIFHGEKGDDKFILRPYQRITRGSNKGTSRYSFLQESSCRHLRPYHEKDASHLKATSLAKFVSKRCQNRENLKRGWVPLINRLRLSIMLRCPAGTEINIRKEAELVMMNGGATEVARSCLHFLRGSNLRESIGVVHDSVKANTPTYYLPVSVRGINVPVWVAPRGVQMTIEKQYGSYSDMLKRCEEVQETSTKQLTGGYAMTQRTKKEKKAFESALRKNPSLKAAYSVLVFGKVVYAFLEDPMFLNGVRRLLLPPFNKVLSAEDIRKVKAYIEIAEFPTRRRAWNILRKVSELRKASGEPATLEKAAAMEAYSKETFGKIRELVMTDGGLMTFYEKLDKAGLALNTFA